MDNQNTKTEVFSLSINYVGINKRCRKSENHFKSDFTSISYNNGEYDVKAIHQMAYDFIMTNVKELHSDVIVNLNHVIKSQDGVFSVQQWEPFSKLNKKERFSRDLFNIAGHR